MSKEATGAIPEDQRKLYSLDGRPKLRYAVPIGLQHVLAMFTGNLAPIFILANIVNLGGGDKVLMIQCAMLASGIATLLQLYPLKIGKFQTGSGLPVVMGTSFAFVPTMSSIAAQYGNIGAVLGGSLIGGFMELIVGIFIKPLRRFFPPVVVGSVLVAIGLSLLDVGANYFAGGVGAADYGSFQNMLLGFIVFLVIIVIQRFCKGMLKVVAILVGITVGYIIGGFMGKVDVTAIANAAWFSVPIPWQIVPEFHLDAIVSFAVIYIVVALETMGNTAGVTVATMDREATGEETSGAIIANAIGSQFAAIFNTLPNAAFGQNVGIVAMTKVVNRFCIATGAVFLILTAFMPKVGAIFTAMPTSVLGGAIITVFSMIFINGLKMLSKTGFDERTVLTLGVTFGLGYGFGMVPGAMANMPYFVQYIFNAPVTAVCVVSILANLLFASWKKENKPVK